MDLSLYMIYTTIEYTKNTIHNIHLNATPNRELRAVVRMQKGKYLHASDRPRHNNTNTSKTAVKKNKSNPCSV